MAKRVKKFEGRKRNPTQMMFLALNMILLAFFILMVALSQPNKTKEAEVAMQVQKAFRTYGGTFLGLGTFVEQTGVSADENLESSRELEQFLGEVSHFVEENKEDKTLSYEIVAEGLIINISEKFSFEPRSSEIVAQSMPLFDSIYNLMLRTTNKVRIEGHSDNVPIRGVTFRDNWQLSAQRAMSVFKYFTAKGEIEPARFAVAGYGPHRPLASNLTESGRQRNRRVTIVFQGKLRRADQP